MMNAMVALVELRPVESVQLSKLVFVITIGISILKKSHTPTHI